MRLLKKWREKRAAKKAVKAAEIYRLNTTFTLTQWLNQDQAEATVDCWTITCDYRDGDPCYPLISRAVMEWLTEGMTTIALITAWREWKGKTFFPGWYYENVRKQHGSQTGLYQKGEEQLCAVQRGLRVDLVNALLDPDIDGVYATDFCQYAYGKLPEGLDSYEALAEAVKTLPFDAYMKHNKNHDILEIKTRRAVFPQKAVEAKLAEICARFDRLMEIDNGTAGEV